MVIKHFRSSGSPMFYLSAITEGRWNWLKRNYERGEKKEAQSICRAELRTLDGRLNTGYQIWSQNKSLSSSFTSHSFYDTPPGAACILCTGPDLRWIADSVKLRLPPSLPLNHYMEVKIPSCWNLLPVWNMSHAFTLGYSTKIQIPKALN